ncbi:MAG: amino acid permease [Burkholderiales bacterium]|nr:amino acid permease [Burkholderiales bacterium]
MIPTLAQKLTRIKPAEDVRAQAIGSALERSLGIFSLAMIGVGATIGTGIFFTMAEAVPKAGPSVILSFLIAAVTAGLTALCYAELSFRIPASGSSYSFAYASLGEFAAFSMAACLLLEYGLAGSAVAIGWSDYLNNFLLNATGWQIPAWLHSPMLVAGANGPEFHPGQFNLPPIILVVLCVLLLIKGTTESAAVNTTMVLIKLAILLFFVVIAFSGFDSKNLHPFFNPDTSKGWGGMSGVTAAAGTVFFSFIGLDTVATAGAEVRNPKRSVPIAILAALAIVTVFYLLVAAAAIGAQPAAKFSGQEAGLAVILQNVTGKAWPALVLSAGAVISVFSVTLVTIYGQTRILYTISRDGLIPRIFHRVSARTRTPIANTVIVGVGVAIVAALVDSNFLWDMVSMGTLTAFIVVSIAVPVMRSKAAAGDAPDAGGFRVPFGPYVVPALSIASCLYIMKDLSRLTFTIFVIWMAAALFVYFVYGVRNSRLNALPQD